MSSSCICGGKKEHGYKAQYLGAPFNYSRYDRILSKKSGIGSAQPLSPFYRLEVFKLRIVEPKSNGNYLLPSHLICRSTQPSENSFASSRFTPADTKLCHKASSTTLVTKDRNSGMVFSRVATLSGNFSFPASRSAISFNNDHLTIIFNNNKRLNWVVTILSYILC